MKLESIKDRLNNIAKMKNVPVTALYKELSFERFLARVLTSRYRDKLRGCP